MIEDFEPEQTQRRSDGEHTHAVILDKAVRLASIKGVNQITLGRLAEKTGVSKSGVYAHFGSKERLQAEIIQAAEQIFQREVIQPALQAPEGLPRLKSFYESYISYVERDVFPGGCFFAGLVSEFDAQTGPIHEAVVAGRRQMEEMVRDLVRDAQTRGEIAEHVDPYLLVFELDALIDHTNFLYVLYRDPTVIERGRAAVAAAIDRARP